MTDSKEVSQTEETHLIKYDEEEPEEQRCSSCLHFPKAVYFIIMTELCERFNYYGMRTILILYLTQHLLLREGNAMSIYHLFVSLCYFSTIIGSFISDNYLGKFKTLVLICSLYAFGSSLMSLTAIPSPNLTGPLISLLLISLGTGGVKACVGPFGGDQIPPTKRVLIDSFFSMFYFAINLGSFMSTILTPILRADVTCNGSDDCYPLAFGVPAILMGIALVIFIIGRQFYIEVPVRDNIYMKSIGCIVIAIKNWFKQRKETPKKPLLDYASNEYSFEFIQDLRTLSRIAILYLPLPIYWALYEQMGSRWTLQAAQMDGEIAGRFVILPDQVSILNVIVVMVFIPIFDSIIYPICYKIRPQLKPLRRMTLGISMACLAFLVAYALQLNIEANQPPKLHKDQARLYLVNSAPCPAIATVKTTNNILRASNYDVSPKGIELVGSQHTVEIEMPKCKKSLTIPITVKPQKVNFLILDSSNNGEIKNYLYSDFHEKNYKGHPLIKFVTTTEFVNYEFEMKHAYTNQKIGVFSVNKSINGNQLFSTDWNKLDKPGRYILNTRLEDKKNSNISKWIGVVISKDDSLVVEATKIVSSSVSAFFIGVSMPEKAPVLIRMPIYNGSTIGIAWQIPQYLLISIGEVLVSVTGLSFSYDQAPEGMKSLVTAFWYLSNAFGNLIVMFVAKLELFEKHSWEYLIFAGLCFIFNIIFAVLAYYYRVKQKMDQNAYEKMMEVSPVHEVE